MMPEMTGMLDSLVADIRAAQLASWERGEYVRLEELLAGRTLSDDALLDLIYAEVLLREEFNERPASEEYERRFPRLAEAIQRQMDLHAALGSMQTWNNDTLTTPQRKEETSIPEVIGNYEILREIGRGGMGIVYLGRHRLLTNRVAAIKVIRSGSNGDEKEHRFAAEAQAVAELHHPNIVPIYELGTYQLGEEERPFVALEYVEGDSLATVINGTPLPPQEAAILLLPLAEAMAHAHERGIVHRDLKPANVLLAEGGALAPRVPVNSRSELTTFVPKITDFGLAKRLDADSGQTHHGAILGTPSYMAPEQATGHVEDIGPACDIYALGSILYEMLTGRPPFRADTILNTLNQVANLEPVPPRTLNPQVPRDLETICLKCLQKTTSKRYSTSTALAEDVRRYLQGEPILARPANVMERALKWVKRRPAAAALTAVSIMAVLGSVALWGYFTIQLRDEKQNAIEKRDEALRQKSYAIEQEALAKRKSQEAIEQEALAIRKSEEAIKQSKRAAQILSVAVSSVDEIAIQVRSAKSEELESRNTGTVLFKLACSYAKTSATLRDDDGLILEDRQRLAEQYALSAVRLLKCAQSVGFFEAVKSKNREALETNADLMCLRSRDDFKRFVASLK